MDQKIFKLSNALVDNNLNEGTIEFAYQGPLLKLKNGSVNFAITGNVDFNIIRKNSIIEKGKCFQNYFLNNNLKRGQLNVCHLLFGLGELDLIHRPFLNNLFLGQVLSV